MRKKILIIVLGFLSLFIIAYTVPMFPRQGNKYTKKTEDRAIKKITQNKKLECSGIGWEGKTNDLEKIQVLFRTEEFFDVEKARKYIIYCAKIYLEEFNSDESVRSYFRNYPLNIFNLKISISSDNTYSEVNLIKLINGIIFYENLKIPIDESIDLHEETYEEALEKLNSKDKNNG